MAIQKHIRNLILQMKLFLKIKILIVSFILLVGLIIGFTIFCYSLEMQSIYYMQSLGNYSFYLCAVFSIICFLFMTYTKKNDLDETMRVIKPHYFYYSIIWLGILFLIINIVCAWMIATILMKNDILSEYIMMYVSSFFLNIFFPLLICGSVSIFLSQLKSYNKSGILLIIFLILISPLFALDFVNGIPGKIISWFLQPFHFLYQADEYSMDFLYGLKDEAYRWSIILFYVLGFVGLYISTLVKNNKRRLLILISTFCLCLISMTYSLRPQSLLKVSASEREINKFYNSKNRPQYIEFKEPTYNFQDMHINIDLKEMLYVDASMKLVSQKKQKEYVFTLYEGYHIQELKSNKAMEYQRQGNLVTIIFNELIENAEIQINYSGYHPSFYSNNQAVALPGYFPWYPMPGEHQILTDFGGDYGYNPYNKIKKTNIMLNIQSQYPIVTNIPKIKDNNYKGSSDSITLFGGFIETGDELCANIFPLELTSDFGKQDLLKSSNEFYQETLEEMDFFNIDRELIENKKIFIQPRSLKRFSMSNNLAIYDDYIIVNAGLLSISDISNYLVEGRGQNSKIIYQLRGNMPEENTEENKQQFLNEMVDYNIEKPEREKLTKILQHMTGDEFIKEFYDYAFGRKEYRDDNDFIKVMEDKYVRN